MSEKTFDVAALGELLIDFTQNGLSEQGNPLFEANPGGAPCNVLAMLRKLGKRCAFLGKVGADGFGRQLAAVAADAGIDLTSLKVDGGASANNYLMQTQADIIDGTVYRPRCVETTAMGAAYLAGLAVGYWNSLDEIRDNWAVDRVFQPRMEDAVREERIRGWRKAVRCAYGWAKED